MLYADESSCKLGVNLALSKSLGAIWLFYNASPQAAVVLLNGQFQKASTAGTPDLLLAHEPKPRLKQLQRKLRKRRKHLTPKQWGFFCCCFVLLFFALDLISINTGKDTLRLFHASVLDIYDCLTCDRCVCSIQWSNISYTCSVHATALE